MKKGMLPVPQAVVSDHHSNNFNNLERENKIKELLLMMNTDREICQIIGTQFKGTASSVTRRIIRKVKAEFANHNNQNLQEIREENIRHCLHMYRSLIRKYEKQDKLAILTVALEYYKQYRSLFPNNLAADKLAEEQQINISFVRAEDAKDAKRD